MGNGFISEDWRTKLNSYVEKLYVEVNDVLLEISVCERGSWLAEWSPLMPR